MTLAGIIQSSDDFLSVVAVCGAFAIPLTAIIGGMISGVVKTRSREATKRELAAYIAEGSMKPEDAERIIRADQKLGSLCRR